MQRETAFVEQAIMNVNISSMRMKTESAITVQKKRIHGLTVAKEADIMEDIMGGVTIRNGFWLYGMVESTK